MKVREVQYKTTRIGATAAGFAIDLMVKYNPNPDNPYEISQ